MKRKQSYYVFCTSISGNDSHDTSCEASCADVVFPFNNSD